jgi:hypothetical protein
LGTRARFISFRFGLAIQAATLFVSPLRQLQMAFCPRDRTKGFPGNSCCRQSWHAASFLGYEYLVEGVRYTGFFVLYGDKELVGQLNESLAGKSIQIRYDPTDLGSSFLASDFNPLFKGLSADQDPDLLRQGLPFDIKSTFGTRLDR